MDLSNTFLITKLGKYQKLQSESRNSFTVWALIIGGVADAMAI